MTDAIEWIRADWPAPANVTAIFTTRVGGVSPPPYDGLNLGSRVGDDPQCVAANRRALRERLRREYPDFDAEPLWLHQVHGTEVVVAGADSGIDPEADAGPGVRDTDR